MNFPGYNETSSSSGTPSEGPHNASLKMMEYEVSSAGNDMLVATFTIDEGEFAGSDLTEYLVMGHSSGVGESQLKEFAENVSTKAHPDGFEWSQDVASWDEFAEQFVTSPPLRVTIKLAHEFSIETERGWKNDVTEEKYEEHKDEGGKGRISADIFGYDKPTSAPTHNIDPNAVEEPSEENSFPGYDDNTSGDGAPEGATDEDGDGLPF
jgi:hypothetical protein